MLQLKLALVPSVFTLALVSVSWVMSTGAVRASEKCITEPNGPPPRDEHWYYRTDRATNRQCWYLAPRDTTVRKRMTEEPKLSGSKLLLPPQAPLRTLRPNEPALDRTSDAIEAETNAPALEPAIRWSEPTKSRDVSPSFERETPRSTNSIDLSPKPASSRTKRLGPATPVQAAVMADRPSPVIVVTLALLALFGPTYHAVRWLRRRKARARWNSERPNRSTLNESYTRTETALNADSTEQLAETLQQLLNEMQTKLYQTSDAVRPITERELGQDQIFATNRTPAIGLSASSH